MAHGRGLFSDSSLTAEAKTQPRSHAIATFCLPSHFITCDGLSGGPGFSPLACGVGCMWGLPQLVALGRWKKGAWWSGLGKVREEKLLAGSEPESLVGGQQHSAEGNNLVRVKKIELKLREHR